MCDEPPSIGAIGKVESPSWKVTCSSGRPSCSAATIDIATGAGNNTVPGMPVAGPILYGLSPYINAGSTETHGIEADVRYRWRLGDMGTITANLSAAHVFGYETEVAGESYQLAGTQGPSSVGGATGNPKDRAQFTLGYARGPLD
ncbi:hypothetical protein LTR94_033260, partial [Friedmanniomyces endolithicus]